jgi:hypothetical protein
MSLKASISSQNAFIDLFLLSTLWCLLAQSKQPIASRNLRRFNSRPLYQAASASNSVTCIINLALTNQGTAPGMVKEGVLRCARISPMSECRISRWVKAQPCTERENVSKYSPTKIA